MSRFTPLDAADKAALQARALSLKPRGNNVVATSLGWAQSRPNGTLELLVSFIALDELLGDVSADQDAAAAPVEVVAEDAPAEEAAAPVKKAGRPKKVAADAAATDTPDATEQDAQ